MKYKLTELIEYLAVPAFVFSIEDREIVAGNAMVIRSYGLCFLKSCTFKFHGHEFPTGESFFLRINRKDPELVLEVCQESKAVFHALMFSDHLGIAYEALFQRPNGAGQVVSRRRHLEDHVANRGENFHIAYIYNIGTGKWSFSQPETLIELGLIKTPEPEIAFDWRSVINPEDLPLYDNTIANAIRHGGNHEIHYRIGCRNGEDIAVADYCGVTAPENQWPILIGSIVVTRRSDNAMIQAEKQVLTGRLLGGMIHDFKNLLGGIRNMIEWSINISHDPQVAETLQKTLGYTDQATELICGTLRLNTSTENGNNGKTEKISLYKIVSGLESLIARIIPSSTKLNIVMEDGLPCIYGQKTILQDMLLNLCVNARDAMKKKGNLLEIRLEKTIITSEHGLSQPYLALSVSDNGCGMSKNEVKRMFDVFYSTKESGVGLGLWMVRNAVQAFDGRIEVESKVGEGSAVRILFPVVEQNVQMSAAEEEIENHIASESIVDYGKMLKNTSKTILYIEDNLLISSSVCNWLESFGFRVLFADNGLDGRDLFDKKHQEIDLVIQDFVLPGMKGDELLAFFCSVRPDIPVIIVSAENDEDCTRRLLEQGAAELIRKPFKIDDLLKSLTRILDI